MKLTLRDLFWLILVVALCVGWWAEHRRQAAQLRSEARFQQWHFETVAAQLKHTTGIKATVDREGVTITLPDGTVAVYVRPAE